MKFTHSSFDTLVRPRVLSKVFVFPRNLPENEHDMYWSNVLSTRRLTYNERLSIYGKTNVHEIFSDLFLGNTTEETQLKQTYVGAITHYLIKVGTTFYVVNKHNFKPTTNKIKALYGKRTSIKILKVGLTIYKGVSPLKSGGYKPIDPWKQTVDYIWFFDKLDIVNFDNIIEFERSKPGDMIFYRRSKAFVLTKKKLNKPKFYLTSSWSCMGISLLCGKKLEVRFVPNRPFQIIK